MSDLVRADVLAQVVESVAEGVYILDKEGVIVFWSKGAERITGYSKEEAVGKHCSDNLLRHVDDKGNELCIDGCPMFASMKDCLPMEAEVFLHHKDGHRVPITAHASPIFDATGKSIGAVQVFSDRSERSSLLSELESLKMEVLTDPLTGLGNRRFAEVSAESAIAEFKENGAEFGLLILDIDFFKRVNDDFGHATGDRVLRMIGWTLANAVRRRDAAVRWGGEEFVVICPGSSSPCCPKSRSARAPSSSARGSGSMTDARSPAQFRWAGPSLARAIPSRASSREPTSASTNARPAAATASWSGIRGPSRVFEDLAPGVIANLADGVIANLADGSIVLVDSSALVYLVEGEPASPRRRAVEAFMAEAGGKGWRLVASALVWQELLEKPLRSGDAELAARYRRLLADSRRIELLVVDVAAAEGAAALAASLAPSRRRWISSADLIHVATAIAAGARAIFGNDESWRELPSCPPLILVDELVADIDPEEG